MAMSTYNYKWENDFGSIELEFELGAVASYNQFEVTIFRHDNPQEKIKRRSEAGRVSFNNDILENETLNGSLWLNISDSGIKYIQADLEYGLAPQDQRLEGVLVEIQIDEYELVKIIPQNPEIPSSEGPGNTEFINVPGSKHNDVFPFIDIQPWPSLTDQELALSFISFTPMAKGKGSDLYYELDGATAFTDAYTLCLKWVDSDKYISMSSELQGLIALFANLESLIELESIFDPQELLSWVLQEFEIKKLKVLEKYLQSETYLEQKDQIWQSWFALAFINGYQEASLKELSKILKFCHFLETLCEIADKERDTEPKYQLWRYVKDLLHSTFLLPGFPFIGGVPQSAPADANSSESTAPPNVDNYIYPYSIGALKQVRHRLLGYSYGELAMVENVMKGEKRELRRVKEERTFDSTHNENTQQNSSTTGSLDEENNLEQKAVLKAAANSTEYNYDSLNSTYGPPSEFTLNGKLTISNSETDPKTSMSNDFAQRVINESKKLMGSMIAQKRLNSRLTIHQEDSVSSFDNSKGQEDLRSTYWWLNKVYEAKVVQYGSRMMIEFIADDPSEWLVSQSASKYGIDLEFPKSPADFGINDYTEITYSKDMVPALMYYGIFDPELITDPKKTISRIIQPGEKVAIDIPEGFQAEWASITFPSSSSTEVTPAYYSGFIGNQSFDNSKGSIDKVALAKEVETISAALIELIGSSEIISSSSTEDQEGSAPAIAAVVLHTPKDKGTAPSEPQTVISDYAVNIEVHCNITAEYQLIEQVEVFTGMENSFEEMKKAYYQHLEDLPKEHKGLFADGEVALMKQSLQSSCLSLLLNLFTAKTGLDLTPTPGQELGAAEIYEPAVAGFLNKVFEWNEMSFTLCENLGTAKLNGFQNLAVAYDSGKNLSAFLQCDYARVLVPILPGFEMKANYFLSTGFIWQGHSLDCPCITSTELTAYAIMQDRRKKWKAESEECWTYEQPTSILVLGDLDFKELIVLNQSN